MTGLLLNRRLLWVGTGSPGDGGAVGGALPSDSPEVLPAVSAAWLAQAEVSVEQLNPGAKRIQRLLNGYESPDWLAPFGESIVPSYPGFG